MNVTHTRAIVLHLHELCVFTTWPFLCVHFVQWHVAAHEKDQRCLSICVATSFRFVSYAVWLFVCVYPHTSVYANCGGARSTRVQPAWPLCRARCIIIQRRVIFSWKSHATGNRRRRFSTCYIRFFRIACINYKMGRWGECKRAFPHENTPRPYD